MNQFFDRNEIKKTISIMKPNNQLVECRILGTANGKKKTMSGYFTDTDTLLDALERVSLRDMTVYFTLNCIDGACYSRAQRDTFLSGTSTTSDPDITRYQWLLVDLDPNRPTGVSSTDEELKKAGDLAVKLYKYLANLGFEEPVRALSGNGYHLLYKIDMEKTEDSEALVKRCLEVLSEMFSNNDVKVDTVNHNPSRICKLHGTLAQKGSNTEDRPHRMSRILSDMENIAVTDEIYLKKLCKQIPIKIAPAKAKPAPTRYASKDFNLEQFLASNGLTYSEMSHSGRDGSTIYALDKCPFDSSHTNGDAKIFKYPDGAISFTCHHNSCNGKKWQDVRLKYDPDAYERTEYDDSIDKGWQAHNKAKKAEQVEVLPESELPAFRNARGIFDEQEPEHEYVKTGILQIDNLMCGLEKQAISVISGLRGSGKSTMIGNLICNAVNGGHTVVVYSGELANKKYLNWLTRQAAGKRHIEISLEHQNGVGVTASIANRIVDWFGDKLWIYNNRCGNDFIRISERLRQCLIDTRADLCIIDNLMALNLSDLDRDKYEAQTKFILKLKDIAIETNTHIICVAHPKKTEGFIRLDDISGTGNIANAVDNAFMVHRQSIDFRTKFEALFGKGSVVKKGLSECDNIIEIAKDRENGTMDKFIPMFFEESTKRMLNQRDEYIHYGWECSEADCALSFN